MRKFDVSAVVTEYDSRVELSPQDLELVEKAHAAASRAYAPYSKFHVGAALLLENGVVVTGNNQENMAYPSGLCAERVAIFSASAQYPEVPVTTIAVVCRSESFEVDRPLSPCGACRQVMAEYEMAHGKDIRVILAGEKGRVQAISSIKQLLPLMFYAGQLKK